MDARLLETFYSLLRMGLGAEPTGLAITSLTENDWRALYKLAKQQTVLGIVLAGIHKLPESNRPPKEMMDAWTVAAFTIAQQNEWLNRESAHVTQLFTERGLHAVILKGQANARLYPDTHSRQCGDIDILVEGGKRNVVRMLKEMGLMEGAKISVLHARLDPKTFGGVIVEVHYNPVTCMPVGPGRRLLDYLAETSAPAKCTLTPEGFFAPPLEFALAMQLSHIRRHFITGGIGLRQLMDYYVLLTQASPEAKATFATHIEALGLKPMYRAVLYVMEKVFALDTSTAPAGTTITPDPVWGQTLLTEILAGGNFGRVIDRSREKLLLYWIKNRLMSLKFLRFDPAEALWVEITYWETFIKYIPLRLKQRKLSLRQ